MCIRDRCDGQDVTEETITSVKEALQSTVLEPYIADFFFVDHDLSLIHI